MAEQTQGQGQQIDVEATTAKAVATINKALVIMQDCLAMTLQEIGRLREEISKTKPKDEPKQ